MKKIGIDARLYSQTGVGTYLKNLLREVALLAPEDMHFYVYMLPGDIKKTTVDPARFTLREAPCKWHTIGEQTRLLQILMEDKLDLMHFTYFGYPVMYGRKFLATVHDLTPLLFKTGKASTKNALYYGIKHLFFKYVLNSQVKRACAVITPTVTVKEQLVARYGEGVRSKIHPLHEGIGHDLTTGKENTSLKTLFPDPFYIYVGNFYPHKNIDRMIRAFAQTSPSFRLFLIGPCDHFSESIHALIKSLRIGERVKFVHNATVPDLIYFYKNAVALIHPTLSEGFGLPLIEAAYFNLPIIASGIPVIRELLGKNYVFFDPLSIEDMKEKIASFSKNPQKFDYGNIAAKYSFAKMADSTVSLYRSMSV